MSTISEKLYDEFLKNYKLNEGLYLYPVENMDNKLKKVDEVKVVYFGKVMIPVSDAVENSVKFKKEISSSTIKAREEMQKYLNSYKNIRLTEEDSYLICDTVEEIVLRNFLWPFNFLCVQTEIKEEEFYPLAYMMENMLHKVFEALDNFCHSVYVTENEIQRRTDNKVEQMNKETDNWAANAPVEVFGTIRRNGRRVEIYANARSTVTSGQVNASYQSNQLLANITANRENIEAQKQFINILENTLINIIKSYPKEWYNSLEQMGPIIGKNLLRDTICKDTTNFKPHIRENALSLINEAPYEVDYYNVKYFLDFYNYDFNDLFGNDIALNIFLDYAEYKKIDTEDFYYKFFSYFYDIKYPIQHEGLFNRFRKTLKEEFRKHYERAKSEHPDLYTDENCEKILTDVYNLTNTVPGLEEKNKKLIINDAHYIYYDVLGDIDKRDKYSEDEDFPVFNA